MIKIGTQITTLLEVEAHANIRDNENVDSLP